MLGASRAGVVEKLHGTSGAQDDIAWRAIRWCMELTVNGELRSVSRGTSLLALLAELGLEDQPCAVEVNRQIVPKRDHEAHQLGDGDTIEIVTLVGGG